MNRQLTLISIYNSLKVKDQLITIRFKAEYPDALVHIQRVNLFLFTWNPGADFSFFLNIGSKWHLFPIEGFNVF